MLDSGPQKSAESVVHELREYAMDNKNETGGVQLQVGIGVGVPKEVSYQGTGAEREDEVDVQAEDGADDHEEGAAEKTG
jgi:hypothetical protein